MSLGNLRHQLIELLNEILPTHSPAGQEEELAALILRRLASFGGAAVRDAHGNIIVRIAGREPGPLTVVSAHKDEIFTLVCRVDPDGKI